MAQAEMLLEMKDICKSFPGVQALRSVHLEVKAREVHVLLGENGAGKSTLIKILAGDYTMDAGHIMMNGERVNIDSPHKAQDLGIACIPQEFNLVPNLSVAENIFLGNLPGGNGLVDWSRLYTQAVDVLKRLRTQIDVKAPVKTLGVANQQIVEIGKALSRDAKIIIMDEPTSALTSHEIEELFETIKTLKHNGKSIIYISHRLEEVLDVGDTITVLRDGENVGTVNSNSTSLSTLISMMVGREIKEKFPKEIVPIGLEIIRIEELSRKGILHDISFCLHTGEILGLFGLIGSGMTELAQSIFGANSIDSGKIYVKGKEVSINHPREAIDNGLGLLPADRKLEGLVQNMAVTGNVTLAALNYLFPRSFLLSENKERKVTQPYVQNLRIKTASLQQLVKFLSGGNQQKVMIARWLCSDSKILFFDQPTRGIDVGAKVEVYQLMNSLVKTGVGIVMISSELPEILGMCDRILVMREGRIVGDLMRDEATQEKLLKLAMAGN